MRIALEVGWSDKPGGARRVAFSAANAMVALRPDYDYALYCSSPQDSLDRRIRQHILARPAPVPPILWDQLIFPEIAVPARLRRDHPDIVLHTNNLTPAFRYRPRVVIIHDMTPFLIPETYHYAHARYQQGYFRRAARTCERIITVSENSRQDICRILKVSQRQVVVAPLASDLASTPLPSVDLADTLALSQPFILYVGAIHPRKNVGRLIAAFARLKRESALPHLLVIAGARRWQPDDPAAARAVAEVAPHLRFTGPVSEDLLVTLYRQCAVFVYPSLYEGFGLPVLEAMSLGAPVVTSNRSSLPEVAADAAVLVDPYDIASIADGMREVLTDPNRAADLRSRGYARAACFSWSHHARIVLDTLEAAFS
jgi:glycosyltransferase involved in cell wall biosynthesis